MKIFILLAAVLFSLIFSSTFANGLTPSKFYADYGTQFAGGETVRVLVKVVGEPQETNPGNRAKEIRHYQAAVLKFILFAGAINVVSGQYQNEFTATMTKPLAEHISKRPDVISVTFIHQGQTSSEGINSPKKQVENGIVPEEVLCKPGLILMIKNSGSPACVTPKTAEKLSNLDWGKIATSIVLP